MICDHGWTPDISPLRRANPIVKAYILLILVLYAAFFLSTSVLWILMPLVVIAMLLSRVPRRLIWSSMRLYALLALPFLILLSVLETRELGTGLIRGIVFYIRVLIIILAGNLVFWTTSPFDLILLAYNKPRFRELALVLAGLLAATHILSRKTTEVITAQRLRGVRFATRDTLSWRRIVILASAIVIPLVCHAIETSEYLDITLKMRGWGISKINELPSHLSLTVRDLSVAGILTLTCLAARSLGF